MTRLELDACEAQFMDPARTLCRVEPRGIFSIRFVSLLNESRIEAVRADSVVGARTRRVLSVRNRGHTHSHTRQRVRASKRATTQLGIRGRRISRVILGNSSETHEFFRASFTKSWRQTISSLKFGNHFKEVRISK